MAQEVRKIVRDVQRDLEQAVDYINILMKDYTDLELSHQKTIKLYSELTEETGSTTESARKKTQRINDLSDELRMLRRVIQDHLQEMKLIFETDFHVTECEFTQVTEKTSWEEHKKNFQNFGNEFRKLATEYTRGQAALKKNDHATGGDNVAKTEDLSSRLLIQKHLMETRDLLVKERWIPPRDSERDDKKFLENQEKRLSILRDDFEEILQKLADYARNKRNIAKQQNLVDNVTAIQKEKDDLVMRNGHLQCENKQLTKKNERLGHELQEALLFRKENELQRVEIDRLKNQLALVLGKKDYFWLRGVWNYRGY
jgi:DNA-binding ferritin-like protein (Dps family)